MGRNGNSKHQLSMLSGAVALALFGATMTGAQAATPVVPETLTLVSESSGEPDVVATYGKLLDVFQVAPDVWGGAYVEDDVLKVNVVGQSLETARAALQKAGISNGVTLVAADISMSTLDKQASAVAAIVAKMGLDGVQSSGPQYSTGSIMVTLELESGAAQSQIEAAVDPATAPIVFEARAGEARTASRYYDTLRYYGGNTLNFSQGLDGSGANGICSTGFQMVGSDGYSYGVSAGHCYRGGPSGTDRPAVWRYATNGDRKKIGTHWSTSITTTGNVSGRKGDLEFYRLDAVSGYANNALGANRVFIGDANATSSRLVTGTGSLPEGYATSVLRTSGSSAYFDGNSTHGEISPDHISLVNQTVYYRDDNLTVTGMTFAEDASECIHPGDSGGAIYLQKNTNEATALGILSGDNGQGGSFTNCRTYYSPMDTFYVAPYIRTS